jgi:hypothetical protein
MRARLTFCALLTAAAFVIALAPPGAAAGSAHANMAIQWNRTMLATFAAASLPPAAANRMAGVVSAATFDAVNGIQRRFTPIHVQPAADPNSSPQAAAASASYTTLVAFFPAQKPALDAALATSLASLEDDSGDGSIAKGVAWGDFVGGQIVAWRSADGFSATAPPFTFQTTPGFWQPTPGGAGAPKFRTLATTTPFALTSPSQFRPAGPPSLDSQRYATDLAEVRAFGRQDSSVRTATQTQTAVFWQVDTPPAQWDRVADGLAQANHLNLIKTARLLALVNIALADSIIAVFEAKNFYNFWRPVTAIAGADPSWLPLMVTPYFQEYPSAHSGVSAAAGTVLASFFGERTDFTVTSAGLPGVERSFSSFTDAENQVADARVWAGFHYRFSCDDGIALGRQVATYVESHLMLPAEDSGGD